MRVVTFLSYKWILSSLFVRLINEQPLCKNRFIFANKSICFMSLNSGWLSECILLEAEKAVSGRKDDFETFGTTHS